MIDCIGAYYTANGDIIPASSLPAGLLESGLCLYEVVRVVNGRCLFVDDHLQRLAASVEMAGAVFHMSREEAGTVLERTIQRNVLQNGNLRLVWKDENGPVLYIWPMPFSYPDATQYNNGVSVSVYRCQRQNPNVKQYVSEYQAAVKSFIAREGVYECLLTDDKGNITEGSRTNVFFIRDDRLVTAPGDLVLKGITRGKVIELCKGLQIGLSECNIPPEELASMEAAFLTGTSPKVLPVHSVGELPFRADHPLVRRLMVAYDRLAGIAGD
jgi:branched-chain amino acid aminotransferase